MEQINYLISPNVFYFVQKNEIFQKLQLGIFEAEANAAW
jgi:hypothetical protein